MTRRIIATVGLVASVFFMVLTVGLITFAQVLPAIATFVVAMTIGLFSVPVLISDRAERSTREEPNQDSFLGTTEQPGPLAPVATYVEALLAVIFIDAAILQLVGARFVVTRYAYWHYPTALRWAVGGVELVAAVALMVPAVAKVAALVLVPVMAGAIYTLLFNGHPAFALAPAALLCMLVYVYWEHSAVRERLLVSHPRRK